MRKFFVYFSNNKKLATLPTWSGNSRSGWRGHIHGRSRVGALVSGSLTGLLFMFLIYDYAYILLKLSYFIFFFYSCFIILNDL